MRIKIPWINNFIFLELPGYWKINTLHLKENPSILDSDEKIFQRLKEVCNSPINSEPLSTLINKIKNKNKDIAIVVDDRTRPTPVEKILNFVDLKLEAAVFDKSKVKIFIANGIHRLMSKEEIEARVGSKIFKDYECLNHDFKDEKSLKHIGISASGIPVTINKYVAEAGLVILISTIESHGQAGFGGGLKNIIPGVAGIDTINYTHSNKHLMMKNSNYRSFSGLKRNINKMRQLIDEGSLFAIKDCEACFLINSILDPIHPIDFVAGDPLKAHEYGVEIVIKFFGFEIKEESDIVIANSSPLDADFRAGTKSMSMSMNFCKKGGYLVNLIQAREGFGDLKMPDVSKLKGFLIKTLPLSILRKGIEKYGGPPDQSGGTLDIIKIAKYFHSYLYIPVIGEINSLKNMGFKFFSKPQEIIDNIDNQIKKSRKFINKKPNVYIIPYGGVVFRKSF